MSFLDKMRKSRGYAPKAEPGQKTPAPDAQQALVHSLREQIERYPNGRLYTRLAEVYREGGDPDKALQVARSGLAAFPNHDGLHYIMGLLLADKGEREEACKHLARAAEIDKFDLAALKLLCQLLGELGRHTEAAGVLARIKASAPKAPAPAPAGSVPAPKAAPAPAPAPAPPRMPAAAPAEELSPAAPAKPVQTAGSGGDSLVAIALSRLTGRDGIEGAILVDASGRTVAAALPAGQSEATAAAVLADLRRTASPVCGELGLGSFEEATVEMLSGAFHLYAIKDQSLGIYATPRSRPGLIAQHAQAVARKITAHESGDAGR
jgi:predicted regulator of Ras-like GTPase activity (Roadblock/LC7/MglB family)